MIRAPSQQLDVDCGGYKLTFSRRTHVMGILNITPDSFSDGGRFFEKDEAARYALNMEKDGADIIDVGGESTRPGARDITAEEECDRVIPVISALSKKLHIPISIDTRKAIVAEESIKSGASVINDVSGLRFDSCMAAVAAKHGVAVIVMHMKGTPQDMQEAPSYTDVVAEVMQGLEESIRIAKLGGIKEEKVIVDPGIGFGKNLKHNIEILRRLDEFKRFNRPICIGLSRKSFIGRILNLSNAGDRVPGTIAANTIAIMKGANLLRVHDVRQAQEAARIADSILT